MKIELKIMMTNTLKIKDIRKMVTIKEEIEVNLQAHVRNK